MLPLPASYLIATALWWIALVPTLWLLLRLRRSRSRRRHPTTWVDAGLSLWMLVACLSLAELGTALFVDLSDAFNTTNLSRRWFELHIEAQRNQAGLRDVRPFLRREPPGVHRVAFIGDSFTIGHGVESRADRFSDRIAARLERARPGRTAVVNLGQPGFSTSDVERRLRGLLSAGFQLDTVVYVYTLNDIEEFHSATLRSIAGIRRSDPGFPLWSRTYLLNWLYVRIWQARTPEASGYFDELAQAYRSEAWDRLLAKLDVLHALCRERGVDLRLAIFPFVHDLGDHYAFRKAHRRLLAYAAGAGIPALDLEPVLAPHAGESLVANRFDPHPNERAHELAAGAIAEGLLADLFREPDAN